MYDFIIQQTLLNWGNSNRCSTQILNKIDILLIIKKGYRVVDKMR
jgi:hypothetical protein